MSILIRTGSSKTDLSYTENAVKNLKVLQKTGTKSVQWITTQAGTTYNNILQKRGVKDLFYGDISIPSDIPAWVANPESGVRVTSPYKIQNTWIESFTDHFWTSTPGKGRGGLGDGNDSGNFKGSDCFQSPKSADIINRWYGGAPFVVSNGRNGDWANPTPTIDKFPNYKKFFVINVNDPSKKLVVLLTRNLNYKGSVAPDVTYGGISYARATYDVRAVYNTIPNIMDGNTYRAGLRLSDT